jgi:hypothetical protein
VTDTHTHTEAVLKGLLHLMTRCVWGGLTVVFELLPHGFPHFGRVSMSAILQTSFSMGAYFSQESVGCGATDLYSYHRRGFLKGATDLHEGNHLPFGGTLLFPCHRVLRLST